MTKRLQSYFANSEINTETDGWKFVGNFCWKIKNRLLTQKVRGPQKGTLITVLECSSLRFLYNKNTHEFTTDLKTF